MTSGDAVATGPDVPRGRRASVRPGTVVAMRWAVFLRGVNVGGVTIRSADLRRVLAALPLSDVATLLASGNVVATYDGDAATLRAMVQDALREAFGYTAWVVVLDAARLRELVAACPYPADDAATQTYLTLTSDPAVLDALDAAVAEADPEAVWTRLGPEATAWTVAKGATLAAARSKLAARAAYASAVTDRNLRTMIKVCDAL